MQQSKAYWQLAAPAGQHNGSSSCILRAFSLALCASMQSGNAVHAVSGDHFVPSMCQVAYSTMGVEERKLPGAVCCTSHHFISTKNEFDRAGRAAPLVTSGDQKSENKQKGENSRPPSELRQLWGEGKKRKNCVMKGVIQTHHANYLHNVSL